MKKLIEKIKAFHARHNAKKTVKTMQAVYNLNCDVKTVQQCDDFRNAIEELKTAIKNGTTDFEPYFEKLEDAKNDFTPPTKYDWFYENFDVIVTALVVAFCFRAYYYQPFKIPTGSMQPTLYGIHTEQNIRPTFWDNQPFKFFKWCATGKSWHDYEIRETGRCTGIGESAIPGYNRVIIANQSYDMPHEVVEKLRPKLISGNLFMRGNSLWKGYVVSGDFLFVNRWIWNFRHPKRGEVMIFSTTGIKGLPPNTHYIKRMCAIPGDTLSIQKPNLLINGKILTEPDRIVQISNQMPPQPGAIPYPGFQPQPENAQTTQLKDTIISEKDSVTMSVREYYALGDNSGNSLDSRYWGKVTAEKLLGPASFVHWPFTSPRWGKIE